MKNICKRLRLYSHFIIMSLLNPWRCLVVDMIKFFLSKWVSQFLFSLVRSFSMGCFVFLTSEIFFLMGKTSFLWVSFFSSGYKIFSRGSSSSKLASYMKTYKTLTNLVQVLHKKFQNSILGRSQFKLNLHFRSIENILTILMLSWLKWLHRKLYP